MSGLGGRRGSPGLHRRNSQTGVGRASGGAPHGLSRLLRTGPVVVILPQEIFYQQVAVEDVPEIVSETVARGRVLDRLLYTDPATGRVVVYDHEVPFYKGQMRKVFSDNGRIDPREIRIIYIEAGIQP